MPTKKQQDMGSGDPVKKTGGMGTSRNRPDEARGGEHGEKRPSNADHDQKIAENRRTMLKEEQQEASTPKEHAAHGSKSSGDTADDVLGQTNGRKSNDPDRERKGGDIVSGRDHSQFPSSQAGYDNRSESERSPRDSDDLSHLDKGRNDDLNELDPNDPKPMK